MWTKSFALLCLTTNALASVIPRATNATSNCTTIATRKEWTNLTSTEKSEYLNAELCLQALPGRTGLTGAVTRFEDLTAIHWAQTTPNDIIHGVGQFLPFHRLFVHAHETLLRTECNYTGPIPWWDETRDAGNYTNSPLLDAETGFGGNGTGNNSCVADGPFANLTLHIGPSNETKEHCLSRNVYETDTLWANQTYVDECDAETTYEAMWECNIVGPHGAGHVGMGGVLADIDASPGDPLFFLHHGWIDRLWYNWQNEDPETRTYELGGYTTKVRPPTGWVNTTVDYVMHTYDILPNVTVGQVMDTKGGYLCYEYDY